MIPEAERKVLIDNWVHTILKRDAAKKYFDIIERLWEASGLTNKDLVDALMSDRENLVPNFKDSVYGDIVWLLKTKISESTALRNLFSDLYAKRFPKASKAVAAFEEDIIAGKQVQISVPDMAKFIKKDNNTDEAEYFMFRVYTSDTIVFNGCIDPSFWKMEHKNSLQNLRKESELGDEYIRFTDDGNAEVFKSKVYARFVQKQRQALADHLKVDESKLAESYDQVMTICEDMEDGSYGFTASAFGLIPAAIMEMMWLNGGTGTWLTNIQSLNRKNKLGYRYRPNFDTLFEKYCRASVRIDYLAFMETEGVFTPIMLSRQCGFKDMETLAISMGYMYMCDCLYQLYKQMQKQYYEDFSWEKYRNRDMKMRYETVFSDLNASLAQRDSQLQNLRILYTSLRDGIEKKNDLARIKELQDKERLLRISEEKDAEIERLKSVIASQNQLIEQLQAEPEESVSDEDESRFDTDGDNIVYHHKYLFVGDITALGFEELRRKFPSSIFMESNTANISQIQVDAVVYLIQAMGHSMHYKCKSTAVLKDAKVIYFNGRGNVTSLLEVMERELQNFCE